MIFSSIIIKHSSVWAGMNHLWIKNLWLNFPAGERQFELITFHCDPFRRLCTMYITFNILDPHYSQAHIHTRDFIMSGRKPWVISHLAVELAECDSFQYMPVINTSCLHIHCDHCLFSITQGAILSGIKVKPDKLALTQPTSVVYSTIALPVYGTLPICLAATASTSLLFLCHVIDIMYSLL